MLLSTALKRAAATGACLLLTTAMTGCADAGSTGSLDVTDGYVKAADMSMSGSDDIAMDPMSAAFMTITNDTGEDVSLTGGTTPAATTVEIHEVVDGQMRPIDGGLVIAAGETSQLQPGSNHVMLIGLTRDLTVGDEVPLTLTFSSGETRELTLPVKQIPGADEPYSSASPSS